MNSEKVKEIKKALQDHSIEKLNYQDRIKIKELDFIDILTYINELESENDTLHTNLCEWRKENQQLKDRIENQRMTKKGFRYEILPSTENSPRRVKDYNEYCNLYNRLAELEDKIEKGLLVPRYSIAKDWKYDWWCIFGVDEQAVIVEQCETEEEAKRKLEELER